MSDSAPATVKTTEPPSAVMKAVPPALHALGLIGAAVAGVLVNDPSVGPALGLSTGVVSLLVGLAGSLVSQNNVNKAEAAPPPCPLDADGEAVDHVTFYASQAAFHASLHGDRPLGIRIMQALDAPTNLPQTAQSEVKKP